MTGSRRKMESGAWSLATLFALSTNDGVECCDEAEESCDAEPNRQSLKIRGLISFVLWILVPQTNRAKRIAC